MSKRMGWLSVYSFTERKGHAERFRWRVQGSDGALLGRSASSFASHEAATTAARRVAALLGSVFKMKDRRRAQA